MVKKVVFTAAIFDFCHEGHLNLLKEMRKAGDKVIVVLHTDESCYRIKGKIPVQHLETRKKNLQITGLVDEILVTEEDDPYRQFARIVKGHEKLLFMRGDDNKKFPGKWYIDQMEVPIKYVKYTESTSSSKIKKELWS